jgi:hypothetical protein
VKLAQQRQAAQARDLRQVALQSATADGSKPMLVEHLSQEVVVLVASDQSVLKTVAPALKSSSDTEVGNRHCLRHAGNSAPLGAGGCL